MVDPDRLFAMIAPNQSCNSKRTWLRKDSFVFLFISLETQVSANSRKNKSLNKVEALYS